MADPAPENFNTVTQQIISGLQPATAGIGCPTADNINAILSPIGGRHRLNILFGLSLEEIYDVCASDQVKQMSIKIPDKCPVKTVKQFGIYVIARKLCPGKSRNVLEKIDYALLENLKFSIIEGIFDNDADKIAVLFQRVDISGKQAFLQSNTADKIRAFFWTVDVQKMLAFFQSNTNDKIRAFFQSNTADQIRAFFQSNTADQIRAFFQSNTADQISASCDDPKVTPMNLFT